MSSRSCARAHRSGSPAASLELPRSISTETFRARIEELNEDPQVAGVIVQQPLPRHIPLSALTDTIMPAKDIDGIHPLNTGLMTLGYEGFLPACAEAAVEIPKFYGYPARGQAGGRHRPQQRRGQAGPAAARCASTARSRSVIGGRVTSRPRSRAPRSSSRLPARRACHAATCSTPARSSSTSASTWSGAASWATSTSNRRLRVAAAITPVPGGVGPVTNAVLLEHLVRAARWQQTGHPLIAGRAPQAPRRIGRGGSAT